MSFNKLEDFTGRYGVRTGQSVINAWNKHNSKREFIDNESPNVPKIKSGEEHNRTLSELERLGTEGNLHHLSDVEESTKDWDCVLLWDPETQVSIPYYAFLPSQVMLIRFYETFISERLNSIVDLTYEGQTSLPTPVSALDFNSRNRNGKKKKRKGGRTAAVPVLNKRQEEDEIEEGEIIEINKEELDADEEDEIEDGEIIEITEEELDADEEEDESGQLHSQCSLGK
ncbi:hypothetical protein Clacol_000143 [Clathrus columnatus]|uniref:Uncharacterized protein n=1 Tax=Clathrus columnatus TaxID=1419009 RepID=A0AAV4ZW86_9AGAM|nr:hypothetical protein Clacol_000143 [Clathrus columnatus]